MSQRPDGLAVARLIDHTQLKPEASRDQIVQLCAEGRQYHFAAVCVNPAYVALCADLLQGASEVAICAVVGFPLGATLTGVKVYEAEQVIVHGATEVDMVMNVGALKSGDGDLVRYDMAAVVDVAHQNGAICKVILETALLVDEEIERACRIAQEIGADFVKTSTGFGPGGATPQGVALMRRVVGPDMGVKASGGIRTYSDLQRMVEAGANRIGASSGVAIVQAARG